MSTIFILEIIAVVLVLALGGLICVYLIKSLRFRQKFEISSTLGFLKKILVPNHRYNAVMHHREVVLKRWEELLEKIKSGDERNLRLAIIEADTLIDEILKAHGHQGNDMGERLKSIHPSELDCLDDLWRAHKIRNELVHNSAFHISPAECQKIIDVYHKVMQELTSKEMELV